MNTFNPQSARLSRDQAAKYLGMTAGTLAVWACTGRHNLPFVKIGNKVFYQKDTLDAFLAAHVVGGGAAL